MHNFIIIDKSDNIISNMYVKNYRRAYELSKMIYSQRKYIKKQ